MAPKRHLSSAETYHMTDLVLCFIAAFGAAVYLRPTSGGNG